MGTDKALVTVAGVSMAQRVAIALVGAGGDPVVCVGGDSAALSALGLHPIADAHPGDGPLAAISTALHHAAAVGAAVLVVAACDHPGLDAATTSQVCAEVRRAGPEIAWAAPVDRTGGVPLIIAMRVEPSVPVVDALLGDGHRSVRDLRSALPGVLVPGLRAHALADVDRPADLPER